MGAEFARAFVAQGASVVIGDVLVTEGQATAESIGDSCRFVPLDVTDPSMWAAVAEVATESFGAPTALVNNAAATARGMLLDLSTEDFRRVIDVNLVGQWQGIKAIAPLMADAGGGSIVNISSLASMRGMPGAGAYAPSKAAIIGLTKVAAVELGPMSIRVNSVLPGWIDTPINNFRQQDLRDPSLWVNLPAQRMGTTSDVAALVAFLASDESGYCTGSEFTVDGGAGIGFFSPPKQA